MNNHRAHVRTIFCFFLLASHVEAMENEFYGGKQQISEDDVASWIETCFVPTPEQDEHIFPSALETYQPEKSLKDKKRPLSGPYEEQSKKMPIDYEAFLLCFPQTSEPQASQFLLMPNSALTPVTPLSSHVPSFDQESLKKKFARQGLLTDTLYPLVDEVIKKKLELGPVFKFPKDLLIFNDGIKTEINGIITKKNSEKFAIIYGELKRFYEQIPFTGDSLIPYYLNILETLRVEKCHAHLMHFYDKKIDRYNLAALEQSLLLRAAFFPERRMALSELEHKCTKANVCQFCIRQGNGIIQQGSKLFFAPEDVPHNLSCQHIVHQQTALLWKECLDWVNASLRKKDIIRPLWMLFAGTVEFSRCLSKCPEILEDKNALVEIRKGYALELCKKIAVSYNEDLLKIQVSPDIIDLPVTLEKPKVSQVIDKYDEADTNFLIHARKRGADYLLSLQTQKINAAESGVKKTISILSNPEYRLIQYESKFLQGFVNYLEKRGTGETSENSSIASFIKFAEQFCPGIPSFDKVLTYAYPHLERENITRFFIKHFPVVSRDDKSLNEFLVLYRQILNKYAVFLKNCDIIKSTTTIIEEDFIYKLQELQNPDVINLVGNLRNILINPGNSEGVVTSVIHRMSALAITWLDARRGNNNCPATQLFFYNELLGRLEVIDGLLTSSTQNASQYFDENMVNIWIDNVSPYVDQLMELELLLI